MLGGAGRDGSNSLMMGGGGGGRGLGVGQAKNGVGVECVWENRGVWKVCGWCNLT